jgi:MFS superfamily sulfate permease-like transporter
LWPAGETTLAESAPPRRGFHLASLRDFRAEWLARDLLAGVTLAAIAVPEQLATARLAGVPAELGLLVFVAGSVAFAIFGANRFLSAGADSTIASIFGGSLAAFAVTGSPDYLALVALLALLVGGLLLAAGLLRAGWVGDLLSGPVTTGFLAGIGIRIAIGQLPALTGTADPGGTMLARLAGIPAIFGQLNPWALGIGLGVLACTALAERISAKLPGALIGVAIACGLVWAFALQGRIEVLGALAVHVLVPAWPHVGFSDALRILPLALTIAIVCMVQTAAVARGFPSGVDGVSRDFVGIGAGCVLAGALGLFPVNASPPRTAVVAQSGGRSQLAGLAAVVLTVALVLLAPRAFTFVPHAALAGILIFVAMRIFRIAEMRAIWRYGGWEILLVAASATLVVLLPIERGVGLAILLSLMQNVLLVARPPCSELFRVPGTTVWWPPGGEAKGEQAPGVLVFAPAAPLQFTNINAICKALRALVAERAPELVVIEANGVIDIDYTGAEVLKAEIARLHDAQVSVALARLESPSAQRAALRTGLIAVLGQQNVFQSVEEAVCARGRVGAVVPRG